MLGQDMRWLEPDALVRIGSVLQVERLGGWWRLEVHAPVVDRTRAGGRAGILHEQDGATRIGAHLVLVVWVFHVDERAGAVCLRAHPELAVDDVPDLREIMLVKGKPGTGLVAQEADVRRGRAVRRRVEQELGG